MKPGFTMIESKSTQSRKMRYCHLQFQKATIEDQQRILLDEIREMRE